MQVLLRLLYLIVVVLSATVLAGAERGVRVHPATNLMTTATGPRVFEENDPDLKRPKWGTYVDQFHLDKVASWLSHRPVKVYCLTPAAAANNKIIQSGAAAYVVINDWGEPQNWTIVAPPACHDAELLLEQPWIGQEDSVWAILVITHESGHMRGGSFPQWDDEGIVNCWAIRRVAAVAQLEFALPPEMAADFSYEAKVIMRHQPRAYRPSGCAK